ncbi:MAG: thioredoxin-dependent thiol peroxidase [Candidatus Latescibacteria bacterium]|jgi:thioredoxin-dependent peroxiredoxin|nr:thioredoxin-dependent thiol peroxidase [Candidatus Latescibacterota bacterium]
MLQLGHPAPNFTMASDQGNDVSLKNLRGSTVVLYFYPKDDTPGCTTESCDFRDQHTEFKHKGAQIFGVSCDDITSHKKFSSKFSLSFPLLSDPDNSVCTSYGVWKEREMNGRKYMGIERTTVVIDGEGNVARIYPKVNVPGHAAEVLKEL